MELLTNCPKLGEIKTGEENKTIPDEIKEELKRRKMLISDKST